MGEQTCQLGIQIEPGEAVWCKGTAVCKLQFYRDGEPAGEPRLACEPHAEGTRLFLSDSGATWTFQRLPLVSDHD